MRLDMRQQALLHGQPGQEAGGVGGGGGRGLGPGRGLPQPPRQRDLGDLCHQDADRQIRGGCGAGERRHTRADLEPGELLEPPGCH